MLRTVLQVLSCIPLILVTTTVLSAPDRDGDRDRLSDWQEIHKYGTDPKNRDSDGDGKPDGEWEERREYAYTIRTVVRVLRPCRPEVMNDDYQDARVLESNEDWIELEVVHYPFNRNAKALTGERSWKRNASRMKEYLRAGITTNWDAKLRRTILAELKEKGVDPSKVSDRELVERAVGLLMDRAKYRYMFGTYFVHFPGGKPAIYPGLERAFAKERGNTDLPLEEHWQHELFGKGMFENRSIGTCTSTAIYLTTGLRALGIPTRMVLGIPFVDRSDPEQMSMVRNGITHHGVRMELLKRLRGLGTGFTSHTFNEVFVGGRWRRLNYRALGQNTYGPGAMGLMTHIHTFNDLTEAGLTETWGVRYGKGLRDEVFRHSNPYRAMQVTDEFGVHCGIPNPEVPELKLPSEVRITKAYWFHSDERPGYIDGNRFGEDGNGHVLFHADLPLAELRPVFGELSREFRLVAEGHPTLRAINDVGRWNCEGYLRIPKEEFGKMRPGVPYRLVPVNPDVGSKWVIVGSVTLTKPR